MHNTVDDRPGRPARPLPRLPAALLRALLPRAERDEVLADIAAEYAERCGRGGPSAARWWLWRQALHSAPALIGWTWWRGRTGFEPRANAFRPGGSMLSSWLADARYAARRLRTRPVYTLVAILTLALGIGGTAAVFGVARPLIIDPLPYANADQVGIFWFDGSWNEEEMTFLRGKYPGFRQVAGYRPNDVTMKNGDEPARLVPGIGTSWELFDVLGARPMLGRGFQAGDDAQGTEPVAVLSYGLWQELGGKQEIVGSRITLDGAPRTVIGVMPRGFWFPSPTVRIWLSWPINPTGRNGSWTLVGHTAPGVDVGAVRPQLDRLTAMLDERFDYPEKWDKTKNAEVTPIRDKLLGAIRPAVVATFVAMGLILLIACANVAALMLGQVEGRSTEMAVRSALGANRRRLTQQLVVEGLLVGLGAAALGALFAAGGFRILADALPLGAWAESARFDWTMFAVALTVAVVASLLVVLIPTVALWRSDIRGSLSVARTGGIQGRGGRMEQGLVIAQVAIAMLIASGAALLARSVNNLYAIDPGADTEGVAVIDVVGSASMGARDRRLALEEIARTMREQPQVASASAAMKIPLRGGGNSFGITIPEKPELPSATTFFRVATLGYFETMGIALKEGRVFDTSDRPSDSVSALTGAAAQAAAPTEIKIVVNEALAKKYFPGESPIGRVVGGGFGLPQRIIGVVENVAEGSLTDEMEPTRYYLAGTVPWWGTAATLVVRAKRSSDAVALIEPTRRTVQRVAPGFAVQGATTMASVMDLAVGPARQVMSLLALLSSLALVLGAVGIYGVISHFAARRKRDWAIKVALGLPGSSVVRHIVGQGAGLVTVGVVLGAIGTMAMARLLTSFLFGVTAVDPLAFAAASLALLAIGVAAAWIPAWRTGKVDPALVLREQ